jgi:hypothetical protein
MIYLTDIEDAYTTREAQPPKIAARRAARGIPENLLRGGA